MLDLHSISGSKDTQKCRAACILVSTGDSGYINKRGDITVELIKKNRKKFVIFSYVILISMMIISVFIVNKSIDFFSIWWQVVIFIEFFNLYDAFIIDAFWVRKTKAWQIPGAEGMDYIPYGSKTKKRAAVAILALPIAALIAGIAMLVI